MRPKKSLGQNFLISPRIVDGIVTAAEIKDGETILEIGPGKGVLTEALLRAGANVIAVEKDEQLVSLLKEKFAKEISEKKLQLISSDILEVENKEIEKYTSKKYKLVANIPYYITGAILEKFLESDCPPISAVLMVQKEVAKRILAHDKKESILSISVKIFGTPSIALNVSRGNFFPIPNVDSTVLVIKDIKNPFVSVKEKDTFFKIVKTGFAHKRKKLISNFPKENIERMKKIFQEMSVSENIRAEDFTLGQWFTLSKKTIGMIRSTRLENQQTREARQELLEKDH